MAIVASRFNESITKRLLDGALQWLKEHNVAERDIDVCWVPGAFEIPLAAQSLARTRRFDAIICLGAVIRGETLHFELIGGQAAAGIMQATLDTRVPMAFGILTTENVQQAMARSDPNGENKGFEAAETAIAMANLVRDLAEQRS